LAKCTCVSQQPARAAAGGRAVYSIQVRARGDL